MDKHQHPAPPLASLMGFGGLIPFFICAGAAHSGVSPWAGLALVIIGIYGAVILSFVGAVHWGLAMTGSRSPAWFVWSVVPALYAWIPIVFLIGACRSGAGDGRQSDDDPRAQLRSRQSPVEIGRRCQ